MRILNPLSLVTKSRFRLQSRGHNILTPTESVFLSLGYSFGLPDDRLAGDEDDAFARAITAHADALETQLTQLTGSFGEATRHTKRSS